MEPQVRRGNDPDLRKVGLHPDFWYPLARSKDVEQGKTCRAVYAGEPIVLARGESGQVFALDDRCAHRQFPLHKGAVCRDSLKCAYHAWTYRSDGQVASVPYLPKGASRPKGVKSYPCREAYGYVFVFAGDPSRAETVRFPEVPSFGSPTSRTMHFWRRIECHYSFMHENLMDMNHQFLHRGILGTIRPALLDCDSGDDWVEARYRFQQAAGKPDRGATFMIGGDSGRSAGDVVTIRTQYPYQTLTLCRAGADRPAIQLWTAYVPHDKAQRSHISVGMLMIEKPKIPGLIHLMWPAVRRFTESVFAEDRMAVEAEQRAYDVQQGDWNQEINPVILALREVLIRKGVPLQQDPVT